MANRVGDVQDEYVIDGAGPKRVYVTGPHVTEKPCPPGRHCAAHCDGPFPCCKCGMTFGLVIGQKVERLAGLLILFALLLAGPALAQWRDPALTAIPNVSAPCPPIPSYCWEPHPPECPCVLPAESSIVAQVPTLSEWALVALGLGLVVAGLRRIR